MEEYFREPCPWRIVDDCGGAFAMGCVGGSLFHAIKGYRNAPSGFKRRFQGSFTAMKQRGPIVGGSFAVWGGLYSTIDCSIAHLRGKEDPWNSIMSGAATGGILAARSGTRAMVSSAIMGGVLLGMIEGVSVVFGYFSNVVVPEQQQQQQLQQQQIPEDPSVLGPSQLPFKSPSYQ